MSASVTWDGLNELARALADLPVAVRDTFKPVLTEGADQIVSETQSAYDAAGVSSLGRGMRIEPSSDPGDLAVRIRVSAPAAHLREFGTVDRYTADGAYRGRVPARPVFIPIVERVRGEVARDLERQLGAVRSSRLDVR